MARGLLVSYAGLPFTACSLFPDNGLAILAGALIGRGHEVRVLDFNTVGTLRRAIAPERTASLAAVAPVLAGGPSPELVGRLLDVNASLELDLRRIADALADDVAVEIERQRSHFVGFKLWSGDGFAASLRIAEAIRRRYPAIKIFGGGPAILYSERAIFGVTDVFDAVVDGEGEEAIIGLAEFAEGAGELASVPNLIVQRDGAVARTRRARLEDPFSFARPSYDPGVYPSLVGDEQVHIFVIDESRGCPNRCHFCIHETASGGRWRSCDPAEFVERAQEILGAYGVGTFRFGGSNTPPRLLDEIAAIISSEKLRLRFSGFGHASTVGQIDLDRLADAGCVSLFIGAESFHPPDLERLGKAVVPGVARDSVKRCFAAGIIPGISLIVPCPGGTDESLRVNHDAVVDLCSAGPSSVMVSIPALIPRTTWWTAKREHGFELLVPEDEYLAITAKYKIRIIVPPSLWEPLPYTLDGKSFAECARESALFQERLAREGVVLNVQDEVVLMADVLGLSLPAIKRTIRDLFFTLDAGAVQSLVSDLNRALEGHGGR